MAVTFLWSPFSLLCLYQDDSFCWPYIFV